MDSIYLDLEAPEDQFKLSDPVAFLNTHNDKLVILDEIQRVPDLFPVLRGLIDKKQGAGTKIRAISFSWFRFHGFDASMV